MQGDEVQEQRDQEERQTERERRQRLRAVELLLARQQEDRRIGRPVLDVVVGRIGVEIVEILFLLPLLVVMIVVIAMF